MRAFLVSLLVAAGAATSAQQLVQTGPPPEIRALVEGFIQAVNGDDAAWDAYAQARYAPAYLQAQTPQERAALHRQIVDRFGIVARGPVRREGPEGPLEISIKGTKAEGVIAVHVDDATFRITRISLDGSLPGDAAGALPPVPIDRTLSGDELTRRLGAYLAGLVRDGVFSGVALVARQGVPVFSQAYGLADRERQVANTPRTRFNIGSINKAFTQIAVNQLVGEGKLSPADTLGALFPAYPQPVSRAATVEQLLSHRGGLADFFGPAFDAADKARFASNADYFAFVGGLPPVFAPGARERYCNGCYVALGAIVEKVAGMPYERYVAEKIFARAGMASTGFPRSDQPAPDIAFGYTRRGPRMSGVAGAPPLVPNVAMHGVVGSAAGGSYSTALDLLAFVNAAKAGAFPGTRGDMGIAGGAPGTNAVIESSGEWTVIVLSNFDPPTGEDLGTAIARALR
jgi:CubicO group peptidase (beta-lactamase class C family)